MAPVASAQEWKIEVFVNLKSSVLDPQGATVQRELNHMGYEHLSNLRMGKYFTLTFSPKLSRAQVEKQVKQICEKVLANPVIEQHQYRIMAGPTKSGK